jgi:hypothetical protein
MVTRVAHIEKIGKYTRAYIQFSHNGGYSWVLLEHIVEYRVFSAKPVIHETN